MGYLYTRAEKVYVACNFIRSKTVR